MSILLPETDTTKLIRILNDSDYYTAESFKIADVLTKSFIDGFLKTGKFYCSMTESSSFSDSFTIFNNKLVARLHKTSIYAINAVEFCKFQSKHLSDDEMKGEKK